MICARVATPAFSGQRRVIVCPVDRIQPNSSATITVIPERQHSVPGMPDGPGQMRLTTAKAYPFRVRRGRCPASTKLPALTTNRGSAPRPTGLFGHLAASAPQPTANLRPVLYLRPIPISADDLALLLQAPCALTRRLIHTIASPFDLLRLQNLPNSATATAPFPMNTPARTHAMDTSPMHASQPAVPLRGAQAEPNHRPSPAQKRPTSSSSTSASSAATTAAPATHQSAPGNPAQRCPPRWLRRAAAMLLRPARERRTSPMRRC